MSETVKHTPGPWKADRDYIDAKDGRIGVAYFPKDFCDESDREPGEPWFDYRNRTQARRDAVRAETYANARIMAAAPDMLAALRECADYLECCFGPTAERLAAEARVVIAEAEGRAP